MTAWILLLVASVCMMAFACRPKRTLSSFIGGKDSNTHAGNGSGKPLSKGQQALNLHMLKPQSRYQQFVMVAVNFVALLGRKTALIVIFFLRLSSYVPAWVCSIFSPRCLFWL